MHLDDLKGLIEERGNVRIDALEKSMIIWFTPRQTTNPPKMDVFPKTFLQIILAATVIGYSAAFKYIRQTAVTTFAFSSPCFFFYSSASTVSWAGGPLNMQV